MSNEPRCGSLNGARPEIIVTAAFSIQRDFRELVDTLGRTLDMIEASDEELRERLANTKAAAERGLRLSKLLLKATRKRRA
jgi:hypothetical protein